MNLNWLTYLTRQALIAEPEIVDVTVVVRSERLDQEVLEVRSDDGHRWRIVVSAEATDDSR